MSDRIDPDPFYAQALMLLERMIQKFPAEAEAPGLLWAQSYFGRLARVEPAQDFRLEQPDSERELKLYKQELKRLRSEQGDQNRQARERRKSVSAHLDEAIALAHPIALRLLGWLHVSDKLDLARVFEVFGASSSTFEGVARLHLIGALRFDDGRLAITSVGTRALRELEIIDEEEGGEDLGVDG